MSRLECQILPLGFECYGYCLKVPSSCDCAEKYTESKILENIVVRASQILNFDRVWGWVTKLECRDVSVKSWPLDLRGGGISSDTLHYVIMPLLQLH